MANNLDDQPPLSDAARFEALIRQVRAGDQQAAADLVREYEPYIRRAARNRLRNSPLRRVLDSLDVCQSVLVSLFHRTAQGQYELETPEQLQRLLVRMVHNKVADAWRRYSVRILGQDGVEHDNHADSALLPDEQVSQQELHALARQHFNADEWTLFEARESGISWAELATQHGGTADSLRKQVSRALERVGEILRDDF